jgi:photosystem II stability/assembly factor-like uncharacterized protein
MRTFKLLKLTLAIIFAINFTSLFADGWTVLTSGTSNRLTSICFINSTTGYAVGDHGTILKTNNGGDTWTSCSWNSVNSYKSVYFTDINVGYIGGPNLEKTNNGGLSWNSQLPDGCFINSIYFINANTGYAVGSNNTGNSIIFKTINGGTDWEERIYDNSYELRSVYFVNASTGFAVGINGTILKTTDAGNSWLSPNSVPISNVLLSVYFTDANTGYISGGFMGGAIYKTTDGGVSWNSQLMTDDPIPSIYFTDINTGYAVGNSGLILQTTNGGTTWIPQISNTTATLNSIYFIESNTGYAVGASGTILKYSGSSIPDATPETSYNNITRIYPNPTSGFFEISFNKPIICDYKIEIFNNLGRLIQTSVNHKSGQTGQIDMSSFPTGVYLIRIRSQNEYYQSKIIKR